MTLPLLVSVGDPGGVGPLVSIRACAKLAHRARLILFGDAARLARLLAAAAPQIVPLPEADPAAVGISLVDVGAVADSVVDAHAPSPEAGRAQLAALDAAIDRALAGGGRAVVTGPTSKAAIQSAGVPFVGQTEHLARRAGLADDAVTMLFLGPRLAVSLVTTHLAMREVPDAITVARVSRATSHLADALGRLGIVAPRLVVASLNPHAGEGGAFGREDIDVLAPAVRALATRLAGPVIGPIGAETAFRRAASGEIDGVVAMFHDQATIASKLLDWGEAVNVTWGLPFVRTSVDHGVAYDAAASGVVSESGMDAALRTALALTVSA